MHTPRTTQILSKIRESHITPIPRWRIRMIRVLWIGAVILALVFLGITLATITAVLSEMGEIFPTLLSNGRTEDVWSLLPTIFWIIIAILLGTATYLAFRHLPRGYRYSVAMVSGILFLLSGMIAILAYTTDIPQSIEESLGDNLPGYDTLRMHRMRVWIRPEEGFLGGRVRRFDRDNHWIEIGVPFEERPWIVRTHRIPDDNL